MTAQSTAAPLRPFQQLPFSRLPAQPIRPHPYFSTETADLEMDSATLGCIRIHYREYGSGQPLLLIHGLMTSGYSWRYLLDGLGAQYRLIIPDLPGSGRSSQPARRLSTASLGLWIGEFQAALGLRGCAAVANSLGGYLCMRHALTDAGAYSRLVAIHPPVFPLPRLHALHTALSVPGAGSLLGWWIRRNPQRWAHQVTHYYDDTLKSREETREYAAPLASTQGTRTFVSYLQDVMAPNGFADFIATLVELRAEQRQFPVPLQLIYSRQDVMVPPVTGEKLAALIDRAQLHQVDRSSHFTHVDSPDRVTPLILNFLHPRDDIQ